MNNRERAESIVRCADLTLILLAAQKFAEAVETLKTIKDHAEDIAKDLHE
ncbi:unnamed protein product [marine sediment metagenome]|uniref:Uncharacterized protein n=1 Tax=marine sediment metagenome TaxID=412755 RepID=X1PWF5_9ZZZZ